MNNTLINVLQTNEKKNIVFYGTSQDQYKLSADEKKAFHIWYMDLDKPIKTDAASFIPDLYAAAEKSVDAFVIMRQMIADQASFSKIQEYCRVHEADIYDETGRDLGRICDEAMQKAYCGRKELEREIESHTCISFDIFDTLLTRKVLLPEDVFDLVERRMASSGRGVVKFKEKRMYAQEELGLTNPSLTEIYHRFKQIYGIDDETAQRCMEMELAVEREVLIPRAEMMEVYQNCLAQGKRVSLVSDMYLTEEMLTPILEKNGISGYERIYLSCDRKQLKLQGLLETYRIETGESSSFLHIGDHRIHDGICAGLAGMDVCLVAGSQQAVKETAFAVCRKQAQTFAERLMLGLAVSKVLNSPFAVHGKEVQKIRIVADYDYGYGFCGALLSQFALFLYQEVKKGDFDNVLFASRDGFLVQKMYGMLRERCQEEVPEGIYFYTSRKAAVMTCIHNEAYINMLLGISEGMSPYSLMKERFGLEQDQQLAYDAKKYKGMDQYVWAHADAIFRRAEEARRGYLKYMGKISLQIGRKYAFMDFVSSGTSQKSLAKIAPFELMGIYAGWNSKESREEAKVQALYQDTDSYFLRHYKIIETFMTSEEPSLSHFDKDGVPMFQKQERSPEETAYIREMQRACLDFFADYLDMAQGVFGDISNRFADSLFAAGSDVMLHEDSILKNISLMDDWRQVRLEKDELVQDYRPDQGAKADDIMRESKMPEQGAATEQRLVSWIMEHDTEEYEILLRDADWEVFYQLSPMRESLFNWYPFSKECSILQFSDGFGALTGVLSRAGKELVVLEKNGIRAQCIEKRWEKEKNLTVLAGTEELLAPGRTFDYIIVEKAVNTSAEMEAWIGRVWRFLKETGRLLFVCRNRFGMKYWCGAPDPVFGQPFAGIRKQERMGRMNYKELMDSLDSIPEVMGWQLYALFPDDRLPQAVYTDKYPPKKSIRDRVIPYYLEKERESLVCLENEISDSLAESGLFPAFANAFLVECAKEVFEGETLFAALSTDRGKEHGFATVICNHGKVLKKMLWPQGRKGLRQMHKNHQEMTRHGVECVREIFTEDAVEMPLIADRPLIEHLKDLFFHQKKDVEKIFDQLYELILRSSEKTDFTECRLEGSGLTKENAGVILKRAYIDMIPYNCFYRDGNFLFYDQEFVRECFPAKYVLFRALRYTYIYVTEAERMLPLAYFKEKYALTKVWQVFEQEEAAFIEDNRNYVQMASFYHWAQVSSDEADRNVERLLKNGI